MKRLFLPSAATLLALAPAAVTAALSAQASPAVDFNRNVRPVLSRHCFKCHGPDDGQRQAKLRLDRRDGATAPAMSGKRPVVPGKPEQSELVHRIFALDPGRVMPPVSTRNPLSAGEKQVLKQWIASGAAYRQHWAFVPPKPVPLPRVKDTRWPRNPIDTFILARLEQAGLKPSPPADPYTLVRRVYLDLIGLPPTPEEVDEFLRECAAEREGSGFRVQGSGRERSGRQGSGIQRVPGVEGSGRQGSERQGSGITASPLNPEPRTLNPKTPRTPNAYERLVDRLLASPHYGERWGRRWLDLARYADTNGYEKDRPRSIWPYRDWVIQALNADMPFDQFTIQQIAGDMLPNAAPDQKIATGFHRNTMLNEEGGIDPLEYRFHAMTDRVATTGTTWLGLTVGCAQCHTHKFDPIQHREYYQFMAFLDNADEPEIPVLKPEIAARRAELEKQALAREKDLPNRFPPAGEIRWQTPTASVRTSSGAVAERLPDGSFRISGTNPATDTYEVTVESDLSPVAAIRLEAIPDASLGGNGPGRTPHGNFVLSEVTVTAAPDGVPDRAQPVKLARAAADFAQDGFPVSQAIDGNPKTGWAIQGSVPWNVQRTATFYLEQPFRNAGGTRWTLRLDQQHGGQHTLGRFRISLGQPADDGRPVEVRRRENLERRFTQWLEQESTRARKWTVLRPVSAKSNLPLLTVLEDGSILASGDQSKRDLYELAFRTDLKGITALRLEVLPDERLPERGPGRIYYEGAHGDFFLSEVTLASGGTPARLTRASQTYASGGSTAAAAIDGDPQTGWSVSGGQGRANTAVFNLAQPLDARDLALRLLFERYYAAGLGRFRISATADPGVAEARVPAAVEELLQIPAARQTAEQRQRLLDYYLSVAPELASEREAIRSLRAQMPAYPTTLVMSERPPENPRPTFIHKRGEFLQPTERVEPGVFSFLQPLPAGAPRNRLAFARWLVDPGNPLVGRVTVNRQWAAFFGTGLVRTTEDFGYQGDPPTHPELLDWLASNFVAGIADCGLGNADLGSPVRAIRNPQPSIRNPQSAIRNPWSLKSLHRLIVTSATYQQSSRVTPERLAKDPQNRLLSRGPRVRLEAELLRDTVLRASGLLSEKIGGPSVFPPQPPGVTSEGTYGPLAWKVSEGEDRYRRGLYTFSKRTAPYAMFTTFDAPSGEACVARREVSNTPLQALTLLNDAVFVEGAQALGRMLGSRPGSVEEKATYLFRRCLTRPPSAEELALLVRFYEGQKARLDRGELSAASVAGAGDGQIKEQAAWTLLARALLNLDEAIVKR